MTPAIKPPRGPKFSKRGGKDDKGKKGPAKPGGPGFFTSFIVTLVVFLILVGVFSLIRDEFGGVEEIPLSQVATHIEGGEIEKIEVEREELTLTFADGMVKKSRKEEGVGLTETLAAYGITAENLRPITIEVDNPSGLGYWLVNLAPFLIPLLFIIFFIWLLTRQVRGSSMQAFSFGQSKARLIEPEDKSKRITFNDVAGVKEAKNELMEIVDFLKYPKKFLNIGAEIPKGVILMGPPGSGKTLLARAVAGTAGVPFFSISGSEFVEMFVGVGASVSGDTPVLIRDESGTRLIPISDFVDRFYHDGERGGLKSISGVETLGYKRLNSGFRGAKKDGKHFFGGSNWSTVKGVYRHKVDEIYELYYKGGVVRTTGDHSIFVRERNMIREKKASEIKKGDILVNLPFKVRSTFVPGVGTTHKVRSHEFVDEHENKYVDLYDEKYKEAVKAYSYALEKRNVLTQSEIAETVGVSQATVKNWQLGYHKPEFLSSNVLEADTPTKLKVSGNLMRLLGYYTAEGRVTRHYTQFVFGMHEHELQEDCISLIKNIFKMEPRVRDVEETNSTRITIPSAVIADFFRKQCGTGSHNKHVPEVLWDTSSEMFFEYLRGYSDGDGYTTKEGRLSMCSVSKHLIRELAWLCSMHGIQASIRRDISPKGRVIRKGGKPLPETVSWKLRIGKTSHPFAEEMKSPHQFKKPIVQKVVKKKHDGYVYDLCGCEGEAFFGGEKPVLFHNSRVRDLFQIAKKKAPSIIFIDEIDAVGRTRGSGVGGGNDEREQTLNQILVEMDGFEPHDQVIIMAATNRPDVLDPALLRPGRFDRRVKIDLPDIHDREAILEIHAKKRPLAEDVNLHTVAVRTPGFSGADLQSLINEASIVAAREDRKKVSQYDLIRSIEKVMLGPERRSHLLSDEEKRITAYHEAGHALVASVLPDAHPVHKISIISRGHAAGYTLHLPTEEKRLKSRKEFIADLAVALGGYVTELMVFDDLTTGPSNDLQMVTKRARAMVTKHGMSEEIGPMALESDAGEVLYGRAAGEHEYSQEVAAKIDREVSRIVKEAMDTADSIVHEHRKLLDIIAAKLLEKETLERDEYEAIISAHGIAVEERKKEESKQS